MSSLFRERIVRSRVLARHLSHERPLSTVNEDVQKVGTPSIARAGSSESHLQELRHRRRRSAPVLGDAHAWQPLPSDRPYYITSERTQALSAEANVCESIIPSSEDELFVAYTGPCKNPECNAFNSYRKRLISSTSITIVCWKCDWTLFRVANCSSDSSRAMSLTRRGRRHSSGPWPSCFDVPFGSNLNGVLHEGFYDEPTRLVDAPTDLHSITRGPASERTPSAASRARHGVIDRAKDAGRSEGAGGPTSQHLISNEALVEGAGRTRKIGLPKATKLSALLKRMRDHLRRKTATQSTHGDKVAKNEDEVEGLRQGDTSESLLRQPPQDRTGPHTIESNEETSSPSRHRRSISFESPPTRRRTMHCQCTANCACRQQAHGTDRATSAGSEMRSSSQPSSTTRPPSSGSRLPPALATFGIGAGLANTIDHERRDSLMEDVADAA